MQRNIRMKWLCTLDSSGIHLFMRTSNAFIRFWRFVPFQVKLAANNRKYNTRSGLVTKKLLCWFKPAVFHRHNLFCSIIIKLNICMKIQCNDHKTQKKLPPLYREESESDEELEWRLLRAGDLDLGLRKTWEQCWTTIKILNPPCPTPPCRAPASAPSSSRPAPPSWWRPPSWAWRPSAPAPSQWSKCHRGPSDIMGSVIGYNL